MVITIYVTTQHLVCHSGLKRFSADIQVCEIFSTGCNYSEFIEATVNAIAKPGTMISFTEITNENSKSAPSLQHQQVILLLLIVLAIKQHLTSQDQLLV
jgi:hypothetical protein